MKKDAKQPQQKTNKDMIDNYDYIGNSGSSNDCTGLIPAAIQDDAELDSYQDIYHFSVPRSKDHLNKEK